MTALYQAVLEDTRSRKLFSRKPSRDQAMQIIHVCNHAHDDSSLHVVTRSRKGRNEATLYAQRTHADE
jgi:hypothetical protein